jgi:NADH-quinone oxidoreductase subunit J
MTEIVLFALFSATAVFFSFNVIFRKNAVHSALHLVGVLLSMSGMFVLLNAQFIAAIQILVYAGAIMVLFLFVVMLLNVKGETPLLTPGAAKGFGFVFALLVFVELLWIVLSNMLGGEGTPAPTAGAVPKEFGSPAEIGRILYSTWLFPFEVTSVLLLIAVIGAVVLAKRKFA